MNGQAAEGRGRRRRARRRPHGRPTISSRRLRARGVPGPRRGRVRAARAGRRDRDRLGRRDVAAAAARVLALAAERGYPPVVVVAEAFSEDEIVGYMRAGARDCVRRGDLVRLEAAVERERVAVRPAPAAPAARLEGDSVESYRALIEEIPALTYVAWADEAGSRAYVSPQLLAMTGFSAGRVAGRARHVGAAAAPGGPRARAAAVPRRVRDGRALRLRVPHPRPRRARRVVARRRGACCPTRAARRASCAASCSTSPSSAWPRSRCGGCASTTSSPACRTG